MDSVSIAFELMAIELDAEEDNLNSAGSESFHNSDYEMAQSYVEKGKALHIFRQRVQDLAEEWKQKFAEDFPNEVVPDELQKARKIIMAGTKSQKTSLMVRFPNGKTFAELKASETFALVIREIGFDPVADLGLTVNREPLISRLPSEKYNDVAIDGYFVKTHSSTQAKKRLLEHISRSLDCDLSVRIIS
ncbi:hypothetical protein [Sulfitobacter sp. 1A15299]|uniref:hypothetical protein n=1 Tax=Sulfitobacter sp. 1A15299 TaxID=3368598 RepID=UPI0037476F07